MTLEEFLILPKYAVLKIYRDEGREDSFLALKKSLQARYKLENGRPDLDKTFRATQRMMPPLESGIKPEIPEPEEPEEVEPELTDEELDRLAEKSGSADFEKDFEWAYANIGNRKVEIAEAPSSAAYFLWDYYRGAKAKLVDTAAKLHAAKNKNASDDEKVMQDDKRKQFALIDALLEPQTCPHCGEEI